MANFTKSYAAKGVLSNVDMTLTETLKKGGILIHDLEAALKMFEGQEITVSLTLKEEIQPKDTEASEEE